MKPTPSLRALSIALVSVLLAWPVLRSFGQFNTSSPQGLPDSVIATIGQIQTQTETLRQDDEKILDALRGRASSPPTSAPSPATTPSSPSSPLTQAAEELKRDDKELARQVQALQEAATQGTPFCEECERVRQAVQSLGSQEWKLAEEAKDAQNDMQNEPSVTSAKLSPKAQNAEKNANEMGEMLGKLKDLNHTLKNANSSMDSRQKAVTAYNEKAAAVRNNIGDNSLGGTGLARTFDQNGASGASITKTAATPQGTQGGGSGPAATIGGDTVGSIKDQKIVDEEKKEEVPELKDTQGQGTNDQPKPSLGQRIKIAICQAGEKVANALGMPKVAAWFAQKTFQPQLDAQRTAMNNASNDYVDNVASSCSNPKGAVTQGCDEAKNLAEERKTIRSIQDNDERNRRMSEWNARVNAQAAEDAKHVSDTNDARNAALEKYQQSQGNMREFVQNSLKRNAIPDGIEVKAYEAGWKDHLAPGDNLTKKTLDHGADVAGLEAKYPENNAPLTKDGKPINSLFRSYDGRTTVEEVKEASGNNETITTKADKQGKVTSSIVKDTIEVQTKYTYYEDGKPKEAIEKILDHKNVVYTAVPASEVPLENGPVPLRAKGVSIESILALGSPTTTTTPTNPSTQASLGASAYTSGNPVSLAPTSGNLVAHEAMHVVQQRQGMVTPTPAATPSPTPSPNPSSAKVTPLPPSQGRPEASSGGGGSSRFTELEESQSSKSYATLTPTQLATVMAGGSIGGPASNINTYASPVPAVQHALFNMLPANGGGSGNCNGMGDHCQTPASALNPMPYPNQAMHAPVQANLIVLVHDPNSLASMNAQGTVQHPNPVQAENIDVMTFDKSGQQVWVQANQLPNESEAFEPISISPTIASFPSVTLTPKPQSPSANRPGN